MSRAADLAAVRSYVTSAMANADALVGRALAMTSADGAPVTDTEVRDDVAYLTKVAGELRCNLLGVLGELAATADDNDESVTDSAAVPS